jgi:hypothetical protein
MQTSIYPPTTSSVRADALFVSALQRSDQPSAGEVRTAIATVVRAYGGRGCAQRVAQEFGDHPDTRGGADGLGSCGGRRGVRVAGSGPRRGRPGMTSGTRDGHDIAEMPGPPGRPTSSSEQLKHVFHELHAEGRNAHCQVCDQQYSAA